MIQFSYQKSQHFYMYQFSLKIIRNSENHINQAIFENVLLKLNLNIQNSQINFVF